MFPYVIREPDLDLTVEVERCTDKDWAILVAGVKAVSESTLIAAVEAFIPQWQSIVQAIEGGVPTRATIAAKISVPNRLRQMLRQWEASQRAVSSEGAVLRRVPQGPA